MGLGGIGIGPLLIILLIVVLLFGTKKLGSLGTDLGSAIRGFKKGLSEDENPDENPENALAKEETDSPDAQRNTQNESEKVSTRD